VLGCANCRDGFPIVRGFGDLRAPPRGPLTAGFAGEPNAATKERSERLLAQLGILGGPGTVALVGEPARAAREIAAALPEIHVAAIDPDLVHWPEADRVSRLVAGPGLPFFGATLRAVAVDGRLGPVWTAEAVRVVAPRGRVVVAHVSEDARAALERAGSSVIASDPETVVAARS
jgi:hypothetical protein